MTLSPSSAGRRSFLALATTLLATVLLSMPLVAQDPANPRSESPTETEAASQSEPGTRAGPTDPVELEAFLDGIMGVQMEETNSVGAVVAVVKDGEVFFAKGYGYADWEARTPVDPGRTLFRIGSVTKLFVWTSVMQLVEEGVLDLDTDINQYIDGFRVPDTYPEPITLAHLLTHSAGFEDHLIRLFGDGPEDVRPMVEVLADQLPARVRPPGDVSSYSNHGTGIAALIVEQASGMPWDRFVQERILDPLGMVQFSLAQPIQGDLAADMSKGYSGQAPNFKEESFEYVSLYPVGAGAASATAMARFMMAHLHFGELDGARILSEETARRMQSDLFQQAPGVNAHLHGFYEMSANGERILGHGGDTFWFHSDLALFPERNLGVFVSFNSRGGGAATGSTIDAFVDRYFPEEEVIPEPPEDFADRAPRFTGKFRANQFSHDTFTKIAALSTVTVSATENGTLRTLDSEWVEVAPLTFDEKSGDQTLIFREGEGGEISHFFLAGSPIMAYERVPWTENPTLHLAIVLFVVVMSLGTILAWPLGWMIRRWHGVRIDDSDRIPTVARLVLSLTAVVSLVFIVGLVVTVARDPLIAAVMPPASLQVVLLIPFPGAALTLASIYYAVVIHKHGLGRRATRFLYSSSVLFFVLLLWQIHTWNLYSWGL